MTSSATPRPLDGVRVVEFGHVAAGPFGSMLLADLGADVVKVEGPAGDQMRQWPPLATDGEERFSHNFASVNRNKRSVLADLKDPDDLARVRGLCLAADVVVENYRPGVLARLGLGYDELAAEHRGLVYASVSGFGQSGPYAGLGAYDVVIQAMSGMMSVTGTDEGELVKAGVPVADFTSGLYAALGVVAWLPQVRASGRSVHLDVPMLDCLLATSALQTSEYWGSGVDPTPRGTRHPRNAPYQVFAAADAPFVLAAGNDRLWRAVCEVVGDPGLADDSRFAAQDGRVAHQLELEKLLTERFAERPAVDWVERLRAAGVPAGPVNTFGDVLADPALRESGLVRPYDVPVAGPSWTTVFPVRATDTEARLDGAAPRLGEQTAEVLAEWGVA
ncbi:CaiB/BaiF CoA-transferase family protein [Nocardioides sp. cx-173]|uniref:CaiB/BaiF CoA transferase family protein n=1 Tax=Nocardioides sp. cx-173 TaxID=2898796 RepID=UPI001E318663|nr:CoA transferase [Nocardioides sp. cx-173]MCD4526867.1 CoA transferase [Nocardioides sp. cx-173]UGB41344.1 CoA transferase [Nocardioides sp. cx-173]